MDLRYDLLLKGGHVLDPKNGIDRVMDLAVRGDRIAEATGDIPAKSAGRVIDVAGLYVMPGLVDIHVHAYAGTGMRGSYAGDNAVYPDGFTFRSGVTTVVDTGGSGWRHFPDFKDRIIDRAQTRVLALLNIVGYGMWGDPIEQNLLDMDAELTAERAKEFPDVVIGIKTAHYKSPDWVPVERTVRAGELAQVPVMIDFGWLLPERTYKELILKKLRTGDICTHQYRKFKPLLDENGKVLPYLFEGKKRGVKFDVGHGMGSFVFRQAIPCMEQGYVPDSISTDLHIGCMNGGMQDMTSVMSKFLTMDMPLTDVVRASTINPAGEINRSDLGHLTPGAEADVTVLKLLEGEFGFTDVDGFRIDGTKKLQCELTLRAGKIMWDLNGIAGDDWQSEAARQFVQSDKPKWAHLL